MGQYFLPIVLGQKTNEDDKEVIKAWMYSHKYGNGLKLMEHSWIKNNFVRTFESLLAPNGEYHMSRVVWAGDYAEAEKDVILKNEDGESFEANLYNLCNNENEITPKETKKYYRYILNHTKKEYVDKDKMIDDNGWKIHPLPLLTSEANGQGGGDYFASGGSEYIGTWARDVISADTKKPKGFKEIIPYFCERDELVPKDDKEVVSELLIDIFDRINIQTPSNFDTILNFILNDIQKENKMDWNSEDVNFSFKNWIESQVN
jgi:hypothetical protein